MRTNICLNSLAIVACGLALVASGVYSKVEVDPCGLERFQDKNAGFLDLKEAYTECRLKLAKDLDDAVSRLPKEAKENAELISEEIIDRLRSGESKFTNLLTDDASPIDLIKGLYDLLELKMKSLDEDDLFVEASKGKEYFKEKVNSLIVGSCKEVNEGLKPVIDIFDAIGRFPNYDGRVSDTTRDWLTRGRACQMVLLEFDNMIPGPFNHIYRKLFYAKNGPAKELHDELVTITSKLKVRRGPKVDPDKLLNYLKRIVEIELQLDDLSLLSDNEKYKLKDYKFLVELANAKEDNCSAEVFHEIRILKIVESVYNGTILNYLQHFGVKQYLVCAQVFHNNLEQAVNELAGDQIKYIDQLASEVVKDGKYDGSAYINMRSIASGIMHFLESKNAIKFKKATTLADLGQYLDLLSQFVCNDIEIKLKDPLLVYYEMVSDIYLDYKFDEMIHGWIVKDKICRSLRRDRRNIIVEMRRFSESESGNRKKKTTKKFFGLF